MVETQNSQLEPGILLAEEQDSDSTVNDDSGDANNKVDEELEMKTTEEKAPTNESDDELSFVILVLALRSLY